MPNHAASPNDQEFRRSFEACEVPPQAFDHRAHVRLAYVYLCEQPLDEAHESMQRSLLAFLDHLSVDASKYHETVTRAWIMAVRHFMAKCSECASAADFIGKNAMLLDTDIMLKHYSAEVPFSPEARNRFVEPDIQRIPKH